MKLGDLGPRGLYENEREVFIDLTPWGGFKWIVPKEQFKPDHPSVRMAAEQIRKLGLTKEKCNESV